MPGNSNALGGEHAVDACQVLGDGDVGPKAFIEQGANCGQGVMAELEDEEAAGFEIMSGFGDEASVKLVTFLAAKESEFRFVPADFRREGIGFAASDVGRIAGN